MGHLPVTFWTSDFQNIGLLSQVYLMALEHEFVVIEGNIFREKNSFFPLVLKEKV
jgi:hypothetical protein